MAGVADQEDIEVSSGATKEPELGGHEPRKRAGACLPTVPPALPDAHVPFGDLDPGAPQARDDLRVAWVVALVGAEVENAHQRPVLWSQ